MLPEPDITLNKKPLGCSHLELWLRAVLLGGNANNSSNAGLSNVNSNNDPSNSNTNYGSRIWQYIQSEDLTNLSKKYFLR